MKVKKYAEETRSIGLAQKLQAYKEATFGLTTQQGKTAVAFAAGSLAVLTPFVAQAQCLTGANVTLTNGQFFDVNNDGVNDVKFIRASTTSLRLEGVGGALIYTFDANPAVFNNVKKFNGGDAIPNNGRFVNNGVNEALCFDGGEFFCGNSVTGFVGIKLSSGKVGFIKITTSSNRTSITITKTESGVSNGSVAANSTAIKAGTCSSLLTALPVELTHFSAKPMSQHITLVWSTASEKNNAYFAIERSRNGVDFSPIGQVKGNGTTQSTHDYGFVDTDVATEGVYYYRLKQVDTDGTATYSAVLSAQLKDATQVKVYPTAVRHNVVNIETSNDKQPTTVVDMTGRVLKQFATTPNQINVSDLAVGVYMVRVGSQVTRIVKSN